MRRLSAILAALVAVLGLSLTAPAQAGQVDAPAVGHYQPHLAGIMNYQEWVWICTVYNIDHWGHVICLDVHTQGQAEDHCNCSGEKLNTWSENGHDFKSLRYFSPYDEWNMVVYRQWNDSAPWKAMNKDWRLGSICCHEEG